MIAVMQEPLRFACAAIAITPFGADGSLDEMGVRAHLRRIADAGIEVYVGGGGSGEGFTLSDTEVRRLLELAAEELGGRVRAMGTEPRTATEMVRFTQVAAAAGVEACQIYSLDPGHGHRPTMAEVERYLLEVLDACPLPAVISTHQSVGYRIPVAMLAELADRYPSVVGINCSQPDVAYLSALVDALGGRLDIRVGGALQALTALGVGAHGFLSSEANLAPRLCAALVDAVHRGDLVAAVDAYGILARLFDLLYGNGGIRVTKAVLDRLGLPGGTVRPPQLLPEPAVVDRVLSQARAWGLAETEGWPG